MEFVSASQTAGKDRDVFVNHGGAYWLNPVPHGTFRSRSACTIMKATDTIDPFGNPKRPDRPVVFGLSRYSTADNRLNAAQQGTNGDDTEMVDDNMRVGGVAEGADAASAFPRTHKDKRDDVDPHDPSPLSPLPSTDARSAEATAVNGEKVPYSSEAMVREKLPLDTANPERRIVHPGNHTIRIPPTGGSAYNGTVGESWTTPRAADGTYLRLAPLYESTTHYQLRTGLYYTEDEAPAHGMTLPKNNSLPRREW
ncbi:hypothetical protein MOQ_007509 [Trypanosoma cruzi marinkellei]|uniref:Uncharacterized protein n=1 Tax=Trypanosoma cruzi marinkellei TaxID=85056 RepID=K2MST3_TRYCR|nr:hypothetical protein MOQ_007509 [Trypanosoma cruzi marinkellei]